MVIENSPLRLLFMKNKKENDFVDLAAFCWRKQIMAIVDGIVTQ